ncbi:response regulator [Cytophagaceae bacterium ABcell3]|nr:response regulator [Cytophagaceae bacterium ABcell3]
MEKGYNDITVLAIDDINSTLAIIEYTLNKKYNVKTMGTGTEALEWMNEGNLPDLIICDLHMPEMEGVDFIKHIRASGFFKDIPLLVLSSNELSSVRIKCLKAGADDFMVKPFNPEELEARVDNLLRRTIKV